MLFKYIFELPSRVYFVIGCGVIDLCDGRANLQSLIFQLVPKLQAELVQTLSFANLKSATPCSPELQAIFISIWLLRFKINYRVRSRARCDIYIKFYCFLIQNQLKNVLQRSRLDSYRISCKLTTHQVIINLRMGFIAAGQTRMESVHLQSTINQRIGSEMQA